jgi:PilZ domain
MYQKVSISPLGWATVSCPECGVESHNKPGKEFQNKVLERTCICGAKFQILFDTRTAPRKKCALSGILSAENTITVEINNISARGASFEVDELDLDVGGVYPLKMNISDDWIEVLIRIIRVNDKIVGFEFVNLGYNQKKMIESYLLSD